MYINQKPVLFQTDDTNLRIFLYDMANAKGLILQTTSRAQIIDTDYRPFVTFNEDGNFQFSARNSPNADSCKPVPLSEFIATIEKFEPGVRLENNMRATSNANGGVNLVGCGASFSLSAGDINKLKALSQ